MLVSSTVRDLTTGSGLPSTTAASGSSRACPASGTSTRSAGPGRGVDTGGRRRPASDARLPCAEPRPGPSGSAGRGSSVATALGLALVLATGGLLLASHGSRPASARVAEDSIGIIDPGRNEVIGQIPVGTRPGGIAVGEGYAWVTNTGEDTVSQIDLDDALRRGSASSRRQTPEGHRRDQRLGLGGQQRRAERVADQHRDRPRRRRPIDVGNGPTAIVVDRRRAVGRQRDR